ncbi:MAG: nickel-dependent hydrogenase large subunit [Thermochromatium sp.]
MSEISVSVDQVGKPAKYSDYTNFNAPVFPTSKQMGFDCHEALRRVLSHWILIENGRIKDYQAGGPRPGMSDHAIGAF